MQNFTIADLVQTKLATLALALFLLPPGYLLGLASNAFGMRSRSAAEKILFSAAYSVAITPILAVLVTRLSSYKVTIAFFLVLAVISIATLVRQLPLPAGFFSRVQRSTWILLGMMLAWFVVVQLSLADLQIGHRLYVNYVAYDHSVRVPFVEAAARTGVPPLNPFYGLGEAPVLRYFYYWYVVCALPMRLFGLSAKACLNASVFWSGVGLASIIPLFLKYVLGETENLRKKSVIGIALLTVTGLDILPCAYIGLRFHLWLGDMEWWDPNQVSSWLGSLLWVPHHVASLTACMAGVARHFRNRRGELSGPESLGRSDIRAGLCQRRRSLGLCHLHLRHLCDFLVLAVACRKEVQDVRHARGCGCFIADSLLALPGGLTLKARQRRQALASASRFLRFAISQPLSRYSKTWGCITLCC